MSLTTAVSLFAIAVTALLARAQGTPKAGTPEAVPGIPPVIWQLASITSADGTEQTPDDPAKYTLQFLPDGFAAIVADCNVGSGPYTIDGNNLDISNIITTLVACPPESISDEYVQRLDEAVSFGFEDEALVLALPTDGDSLRFLPTLTGVVWEWQGFLGGDDSEVIPENPANYTLQFLSDGTINVQADCNRGRGSYTAESGQIDLTAIALTRMACPPGSLSSEFVADLEEVNTFVFRDGNLYLALPVDVGIHEFTARVAELEQATPTASPVAGG